MDFKNSTFMYLLGGIVGIFVIAQSLYFLIRAARRGKELGVTRAVIKKLLFPVRFLLFCRLFPFYWG